ncbi:MAG: GAF domain-containing protein [Gammaproteobacteria bacterium]|jgi:GAF domain-containing protein
MFLRKTKSQAAQQPPLDKSDLQKKLNEIRAKQKAVDAKWQKTGNRGMLEFFVEVIPMALNVDRCSIFVLDPKSANIWLHCGTGVEERSISVGKENSIVGDVVSTGRMVIADDLEERMGAHYEVAMQTGFQPRNTLCVPIIGTSTKKVTGAIQVLNKRTHVVENIYSEKDIEILNKLARLIQNHIENVFLRQELSKISQAMSNQIKVLEGKLKTMK